MCCCSWFCTGGAAGSSVSRANAECKFTKQINRPFFVVAKNRCQCFVLKLVLADGLPGVHSCWWDLRKGDAMLSFLGRTK